MLMIMIMRIIFILMQMRGITMSTTKWSHEQLWYSEFYYDDDDDDNDDNNNTDDDDGWW